MKRIAVILFSLVLVYGGVAWALERCLSHDEEHEHSVKHRDFHRHGSTVVLDSHDSSRPVIHCPLAEIRIGPAAQSGSGHLNRGHRVATVRAPSFYQPALPTSRKGLWLDAVFRRDLAFAHPDDLDFHLLFSVLQI